MVILLQQVNLLSIIFYQMVVTCSTEYGGSCYTSATIAKILVHEGIIQAAVLGLTDPALIQVRLCNLFQIWMDFLTGEDWRMM